MKILLVEDDPGISRFVTNGLKVEGFGVDWFRTGGPVFKHLQTGSYAAMILDLMLPDIDGFHVCRHARAMGITTPICMVSACDSMEDKLKGFEAGTDDYLIKPFSIDELIARLKVMLRRGMQAKEECIVIDTLEINRHSRQVWVAGTEIPLTSREFDVLYFLAQNHNRVVTRDQLLQGAWDFAADVTSNSVDVYVGYVRRKLGQRGCASTIKTVRGFGYRLA